MIQCFMVAEIDDCWHEGGGNNVGAMCLWIHGRDEHDVQPRPMPHLGVMTPAGLFCTDCPASDPPHGYWTKTGEPPKVTLTPSINVNHDEWHGFLTDGVLTP